MQILLSSKRPNKVPSCSRLDLDGFVYYRVCVRVRECVLKGFIPLSLLTGVLLTTYTIKCRYKLLAVSVITYTHIRKITHSFSVKQLDNYAASLHTHTQTHRHTHVQGRFWRQRN